MSLGYLDKLRRANAIIIVPMNGLGFCDFAQHNAIGTEELGSCHAIVIASSKAAILAHISPRANLTDTDPMAGDRHVSNFMDKIVERLHEHRKQFGSRPESWIVCAWYKGSVALPDQEKIIRNKLEAVGLQIAPVVAYSVDPAALFPGKGTIVVENQTGQTNVYVEDRKVGNTTVLPPKDSRESSISKPSSSGSAISAASDGVFDERAQRYRKVVNGRWQWNPYRLTNGKWKYEPVEENQ